MVDKEKDRFVEAVGYQAHDPAGQGQPEPVLDKLVKSVRLPEGPAWWACTCPAISERRTNWPTKGKTDFDFRSRPVRR